MVTTLIANIAIKNMNYINNMKSLVLTIGLSLFLAGTTIAGGGWPPKKGKGFFKFGQSVIRASQFYAPNGDLEDITTLSLYTTSIYGEYGLSDRISAVAYVPFFVRSTINEIQLRQSGTVTPGDEVNALGDAELGLTYALTRDTKIALSTSLIFGLPLGETEGGEGRILQTGDGEFNQYLKLDAGVSFYPAPLYASAHIGINNRTNNFSEEFRYGFELGYTGINKVTAILKANSVISFQNGEGGGTANGIFSNNTEFFAFGPTLTYDLKENFGALASATFALSGKRILAAPAYEVGVFLKL